MTFPTPPPNNPHPFQRPINRGTALPWDLPVWHDKMRALASTPTSAYARVVELERLQPRNDDVGFRIYAVSGHEVLGAKELTTRHGHLVIGRHSSCDFILPNSDEAISLRHVIVRVSVLDDGLPLLNVLDLDSGLGFELSLDTNTTNTNTNTNARQRAIVASGPIAFRIGNVWLVALPMNAVLPDRLEAPLVRHTDGGSYRVGARGMHDEQDHQHAHQLRAPFGRTRNSEIAIVGRSLRLSETSNTGLNWLQSNAFLDPRCICVGPMPFRGSVGGSFALTVQAGGREAGILLTERDVSHGVLIGRDDRCVDAGLRAVLDQGISRVHALVIRERQGVLLYDVASTNGTSDGTRRRIASMPLLDEGTTAWLGGRIAMRWRALR